jgi:hypothetical protein
MRTENGPQSFDAYLVAHQRAYMWAERATLYRSAGNFSQAEEAVESARYWLGEIESMDVPGAHRRPELEAPLSLRRTDRGGNGVPLHVANDGVQARLTQAERIVLEAQKAATPRQGYTGFDLALQTIRECTRALSAEPARNPAATLQLLDTVQGALVLTSGGDAAQSVQEAIKLIDEASAIVTPAS